MKTLKTFLFTGISTLLLFACEDTGVEVTTLSSPNFEAVFTGKNPTITPIGVSECGKSFSQEFRGEGDSDLLGPFTIVKRYCFDDHSAPDKFALHFFTASGKFILAAREKDDTIVGIYDGDVSSIDGFSILMEKFTITGGTGKYQNASGYLTVNTSGSEELTGKIRGRIQLESSLSASNHN